MVNLLIIESILRELSMDTLRSRVAVYRLSLKSKAVINKPQEVLQKTLAEYLDNKLVMSMVLQTMINYKRQMMGLDFKFISRLFEQYTGKELLKVLFLLNRMYDAL